LRFAIGAGADALSWGQATRAADHLLRQRETLAGVLRRLRQAEHGRCWKPEELARLRGQRAADDQVDAAAGAHLVEQHVALDLERRARPAVAPDPPALR